MHHKKTPVRLTKDVTAEEGCLQTNDLTIVFWRHSGSACEQVTVLLRGWTQQEDCCPPFLSNRLTVHSTRMSSDEGTNTEGNWRPSQRGSDERLSVAEVEVWMRTRTTTACPAWAGRAVSQSTARATYDVVERPTKENGNDVGSSEVEIQVLLLVAL
ncbi:hypothetical protein BLNAU_12432 [Blattamonas nauphoetae]|uniref:Uncharacterized protein n=1 Tax=Blattamonas nauphoetae TaxID=2049346 RepID=A0ABQ9XM69_9EUKA|nr:hypothetical protein BLNAU_12432 [Blattamonas nauphoetae]